MGRCHTLRHIPVGFLRRTPAGFSRRFCLLCAMALMLCRPLPATAGIADWWDIHSGAAEREIERLNRNADVALAWHHSKRLFEVRQAMQFAILRLKPPHIEALIANLDDPDRTLDDLRLPADKDGFSTLSAQETREILGLPEDGLEQEGISVVRASDIMIVYHDIERRRLVRFGQDEGAAERLLATLHQDIRENPPVPKHITKVRSQLFEHMPLLIKGGKMFQHNGLEYTACRNLLDRIPDTPTIALCGVYTPRTSRENIRVGDCTGDRIGGVFRTVYLINGEESRRSEPWDNCVPKPPLGASQQEREEVERECHNHPRMTEFLSGLIGSYGNGYDFEIDGDFHRQRTHWVHKEEFPDTWKLPPLVLRWKDEWDVHVDTCAVLWKTDATETETRPKDRCRQDWQRDLIYRWSQRPDGSRQPGNPPVKLRRDWYEVGGYYDCPPPQRWTTGETETGSYRVKGCRQGRQRTVTKHWLLRGEPWSTTELEYTTRGEWSDVGGRTDCRPRVVSTGGGDNGGGGENGGGGSVGRGYDTDGDGVTDSTDGSGGHYGYSDRGIGSEASGGWTGGGFGKGEWSGSSNLGGAGAWSGGFGRGRSGGSGSNGGSRGSSGGNNSGSGSSSGSSGGSSGGRGGGGWGGSGSDFGDANSQR